MIPKSTIIFIIEMFNSILSTILFGIYYFSMETHIVQ